MNDLSDQFRLSGRIALVVGATEGIGRDIALGLASAGADVALTGRRSNELAGVATQIKALGRRAEFVAADVTRVGDIEKLREFVLHRYDRLDILVNSAGYTVTKPAWEIGEQDWDRTLGVSFKGLFFCCQILGSIMRRQKYGKIINLGSTLGCMTMFGRSIYAGVKAGISHLSEALAVEWAADGIRVNVLAPTAVMTPTRLETLQGALLADLVRRTPLGRIAEAGDLASAAVYLAAPASDYITGQTLYIDGGLTAHG